MKLSLCIDQGILWNGIYIAKTSEEEVISKKSTCIKLDKNSINFSKKIRRENRHKKRNYKRNKLAKRLIQEFVNFDNFSQTQKEKIFGLLNNRGYTFLNTSSDFKELRQPCLIFLQEHLKQLNKLKTKEDFEDYLANNFDDEDELDIFLNKTIKNINKLGDDLDNFIKKKEILSDLDNLEFKTNFDFSCFAYIKKLLLEKYDDIGKNQKQIQENIFKKDFDLKRIDFSAQRIYLKNLNFKEKTTKESASIFKDLRALKAFLENINKELKTGAKPRIKYLEEIKEEILKLDFIQEKESFYNLVGNISNLQLRVLRKFFNFNSKKDRYDILKSYFQAHHYNSDKEKEKRKSLFQNLDSFKDLEYFFKNSPPKLSIPPYEDVSNKNMHKCTSFLIKEELIDSKIKKAIMCLLKKDFSFLVDEADKSDGFVKSKKEEIISKEDELNYPKYLQRILDCNKKQVLKWQNPRNIFKTKNKIDSETKEDYVNKFKKHFGIRTYEALEPLAKKYYLEEQELTNGIFEKEKSIFSKCEANTAYKNNIKHILLARVFSCDFSPKKAEKFLSDIKNTRSLEKDLKLIFDMHKKYSKDLNKIVIYSCENPEDIEDKDILKLIKNFEQTLTSFKNALKLQKYNIPILKDLEFKKNSIAKELFILQKTYEILFKDLNNFNKICKSCEMENTLRNKNNEKNIPLAKPLLFHNTSPIKGVLDMALDKLAFELSLEFDEDDFKNVDTFEIFSAQDESKFEVQLKEIKRNKKLTKPKEKNALNASFCPFLDKQFENGTFHYILEEDLETKEQIFHSKANMLYTSLDFTNKKSIKTLDELGKKHLKEIFKSDNINIIKTTIKQGLKSINKKDFSSFLGLNPKQQIGMRYALLLNSSTKEYKFALELAKKDKILDKSNAVIRRLTNLIYEKLSKRFPKCFENISFRSKTIDYDFIKAQRNALSKTNQVPAQNNSSPHSQAINAMVIFYLAKDMNGKKKYFSFDDIYLENSSLKSIVKKNSFVQLQSKQSKALSLFQNTLYAEHYHNIQFENKKFISEKKPIKAKQIEKLISYGLLYLKNKNKKFFLQNMEELEENFIYKIDVDKTSWLIYELFLQKNTKELESLKFLDVLRYCTTKKDIFEVFFKDNKLLDFSKINKIPPQRKAQVFALYKQVQKTKDLFIYKDSKQVLNKQALEQTLKDTFKRSQNQSSRVRKKTKFKLTILGQNAGYRIKREGNIWQVLGGENIATKNYLIDKNIKAIPFFSKNTLPLKISDLINCAMLKQNTKNIYELNIGFEDVAKHICKLKYFLSEAKRFKLIVGLKKSSFENIDFDKIAYFDGNKDEIFKHFLLTCVENKEHELNPYLGSIRDGLKAKAQVLENTQDEIYLQYTVGINNKYKEIILKNIK